MEQDAEDVRKGERNNEQVVLSIRSRPRSAASVTVFCSKQTELLSRCKSSFCCLFHPLHMDCSLLEKPSVKEKYTILGRVAILWASYRCSLEVERMERCTLQSRLVRATRRIVTWP